jgi:LysM repeat protein
MEFIMKSVIFVLGIILFIGSGCETLSGQQKRQKEMRLHNDITNLKASVERLEQRLDGIEAGREDVYAQISDSQANREKSATQYAADIEALNSKLMAQKKAQALREKQMVSDLSKTMVGIMEKNATTSGGSVSGVEHPVQAGETLSEIAAAYGVQTKAIIKANRMKNPDDLKIGQLLIIPD